MSDIPADTVLNDTSFAAVEDANGANELEQKPQIERPKDGTDSKSVTISGVAVEGHRSEHLAELTTANNPTENAAVDTLQSPVEPEEQLVAIGQIKQEDDVFGDHSFDYSDYLFDHTSDSASTDLNSGPSNTSLHLNHVSSEPPGTTAPPPPPPSSSLTTDSLLSFDLSQSASSQHHQPHHPQHQSQHLHYTSQTHDPSTNPSHHSENDFVHSSIGAGGDNSGVNDFMLFDASMLDTSTDLSEMPETNSTGDVNKVDYFNQSSTSLQSPLSQHQSQALHDNGDYVQYHQINGNGVDNSANVTPHNDSNNNPVNEMADDLKSNIHSMLNGSDTGRGSTMGVSINNTCQTPSDQINLANNGRQMSQPTSNQYITSSVGSMLNTSTSVTSNVSEASNQIDTASANSGAMLVDQTQQMQHQSQSTQVSASGEEDNMLNMIPNAFACLLPGEADIEMNPTQQQPQPPQSSVQHTSGVSCMSDSGMYHQHHMQHQLQQQSQQSTQTLQDSSNQLNSQQHLHHHHFNQNPHQQPQQQQQQMTSQEHHSLSNHHSHLYQQTPGPSQQQQTVSQHHHQIVANAQSTPTMEYGQPTQMDISTASMSMDNANQPPPSSSSGASSHHQHQSQISQSTNPSSTMSSANLVVDNRLSQPPSTPVPSPGSCSSYGNVASTTTTPTASVANTPSSTSDYLLQSNQHQVAPQHHHQQQQIHQPQQSPYHGGGQLMSNSCTTSSSVVASSTTMSSPTISTTSSMHHQQQLSLAANSLTNTAHQRTSHYMPSANQIPPSSLNGSTVNCQSSSSTMSGANISTDHSSASNGNLNASVSSSDPNNSIITTTQSAMSSQQQQTIAHEENRLLNQYETSSSTQIDSISSVGLNNNSYVLSQCDQSPSNNAVARYSEPSSSTNSHQNVSSSDIQSQQQQQYENIATSASNGSNVMAQVPQHQQQMQPIKVETSGSSTISPIDNNTLQLQKQHHQQQAHNVSVSQQQQQQAQVSRSDSQQQLSQASGQSTQSLQYGSPGSSICMVALPNRGLTNILHPSQISMNPPMSSNNQASGGAGGMQSVCMIADTNVATLTPMSQHQSTDMIQQTTQQSQVNIATLQNLPPKKIRGPTNATGNSQLGNQTTLLFASKSSVVSTANNQQTLRQNSSTLQSVSSQAPSQTTSNQNAMQAMILPSTFSFHQAQPIPGNQVNNIITPLHTISLSDLQNVAVSNPVKQQQHHTHFVPSSSNTEQNNYQQTELLVQRQYMSTDSSGTSGVGADSATTAVDAPLLSNRYQTSNATSIQSGSPYGHVQSDSISNTSVIGSTANIVSATSQPQILFNNSGAQSGNYSILTLGAAPSSSQRQPGNGQLARLQTNKQTVSHKILVHALPPTSSNTLHSESASNSVITGQHRSGGNPTAATLISLNSNLNHLPTLAANSSIHNIGNVNPSPVLNNSIPTGSIIFSNIIQNQPNLAGKTSAHNDRGSVATSFAVPIPMVNSAAVPGDRRSSGQQIISNIVAQSAPATQFTLNTPFLHNPTGQSTLVPNIVPHTQASGRPQVVALATKSNKLSSKTASKSSANTNGANKAPNTGGSSSNIAHPSSSTGNNSGRFANLPPLVSEDPTKPFKCSICGKNLASRNVYQLHLRSHSGEKPFVCNLCSNGFSQKTSLTRHMRSHTGERPFPCKVCNKCFADKERIKIHMRIHTGEKPFSCSVCHKQFSQKSTVKRHMSVHTGVKPFKCGICNKGFANRGNLTAHTKTHQSNSGTQQHQSRNNKHSMASSNSIIIATNSTAANSSSGNKSASQPNQIVATVVSHQTNEMPANSNSSATNREVNTLGNSNHHQHHDLGNISEGIDLNTNIIVGDGNKSANMVLTTTNNSNNNEHSVVSNSNSGSHLSHATVSQYGTNSTTTQLSPVIQHHQQQQLPATSSAQVATSATS